MEEFKQYVIGVIDRYEALEEKDKEAIRRIKQSKAGQTLMGVIGPDFQPLFDRLAEPKAKGLASPKK